MRVITGTARGRKLLQPTGMDIRPTADRVKEAIFSIIQFDIPGRRVLDLFAGSGQLGIEALSRGADSAVFIEYNKAGAEVVRQNLKNTGFSEKSTLLQTDAFHFLNSSSGHFGLAFLDPPYGLEMISKALPLLTELMAEGSLIVCETLVDEHLPEQVNDFKLQKKYKYSKTQIWLYRNTD